MPDDTFTSGDIASAADDAASGEVSPARQPGEAQEPEPSPRVTAELTREPTPGHVPFADHQRVVDGFHARLDRLSWADHMDPDRVNRALAFVEQHEREERNRPSPEPVPDVQDERGEAFYSPRQAAALVQHHLAAAMDELRGEFADRLGPIEARDAEGRQLESLSSQVEGAMSWPGFNEHIDAITAAVAQANAQHQRLGLHDAYIQIVVPKLSASRQVLEIELRKAILAEMNDTSVRARDEVHPSRRPGGSRKSDKDKSFKELLGEEYAAAASR
ncbi:MAG: hypothetical protein ACREJC_10815 [Tepidisphaeraceae bacterium]